MKLRFVKFLTSRENEIERKEEGGQRLKLQCLFSPGQSAALLPLPPPSPSIIPLSSTQPHQPAPSAAQLPLRHGSGEQYSPAIPSLAVPPLPSFFIKLPKQQSVVAAVPSQPVQLSCPTIACGAQLAAPLPPTQSGGRSSSPVLMTASLWRVEP